MKIAFQFLGLYFVILTVGIIIVTEARSVEGSAYTLYRVGTTGFSCLVSDKNRLSLNCGFHVHEKQVRALKVHNQVIQHAKKVERTKSVVKAYEDILLYLYDLHKREALRSA